MNPADPPRVLLVEDDPVSAAFLQDALTALPVQVSLATTELVTVIRPGFNGFIDTRIDVLIDGMKDLLADPKEAHRMGERARQAARERFGIERFVADWQEALRTVAG